MLLINLVFTPAGTVHAAPALSGTISVTTGYSESFESGAGGWTTAGTNNSWELGAPADTTIDSASDGAQAWTTGLSTDYNAAEESYVLSPSFDFTALSTPAISLDVWWESIMDGGSSGASLQYSTDGGASWTTVGEVGEPQNWYNYNPIYGLSWSGSEKAWSGHSGGWRTATHSLASLGGAANVVFRIAFGSDNFFPTDDGFAFDNVRIYNNNIPDCARLLSPADDAASVPVNTGYSWIVPRGIPTGYRFYLGTDYPPTNIENGTALTGETHQRSTYLETSTTYYWQIVPSNASGSPTGCPVGSFTTGAVVPINAFPYLQGFESGAGGWSSAGVNSSWGLGTPAADIITGASGGSQAWMTGLVDGYQNDEQSYVVSPTFDFTNLAHPYIKLDLWWDAESAGDGANLQYSTDGGDTWTVAGGTSDGYGWYKVDSVAGLNTAPGWSGSLAGEASDGVFSSHGWRTAIHDLDWLGGKPNVRLRFFFGSDAANTSDGFAFDNIEIRSGCAWASFEENDGQWFTAGNWNCGHVPTTDDIVVIEGGEVPTPRLSSVKAQAAAVVANIADVLYGGDLETRFVYEATPISVDAEHAINLIGSGIVWQTNIAATPTSGTLRFSGPGVQRMVRNVTSTAPGATTLQTYDLVVAAGTELKVEGDLNVTHNLDVQSGAILNMGANEINVGGSLTNAGALNRQTTVSTETAFFHTGGYGGLILNPNGQNLGLAGVLISGSQGCTTDSVKRCFNVTAGSAPSSATLTFFFAAADIPEGQTCAGMEVYRQDGASWSGALTRDSAYGTEGRDCTAEPYSIRVSGVTEFSLFTLKSNGAPVPAVYGVNLTAAQDALNGEPGANVNYTLSITNTGNVSETFALSAAGNLWSTNLPATIGPLAVNETRTFVVAVAIPADAAQPASDSVTITAAAQHDATRTAAVRLTTWAGSYSRFVYLPMIIR